MGDEGKVGETTPSVTKSQQTTHVLRSTFLGDEEEN